ncbi:MAG TPA: IS110 family transposase [Gemmatimonadales bacterium]|nr:IS110 family transposase [Gemmatimonadales bacterium]
MGIAVGLDVAKEFHWATAVEAASGQVLLSRRVENHPADIQSLIDELEALGAERAPARVGVDVVGGIAALVVAMLHESGLQVLHVPGLAVNRARQGTTGGEHKSDPKDARVIADQVRTRADLRALEALSAVEVELRLLVGRRRELVSDQTRRLARLRDLLSSIHPGLERVVDPTQKAGLWLLSRYVTPAEIRRAGRRRLIEHLGRAGHLRRSHREALADAALDAAQAQRMVLPGERVAAELVRELAGEALAVRERLARLDADLEAPLARHPDAALIQSLPGMGATLTAEFIAEAGGIERFASSDHLAAAAGLAPVLKQSGKVRYLQRASGGNKALKRVFYQSAFCSLGSPASRRFYERKRREGKRHHQALIALARRRIDVLHAMLRTREPYRFTAAEAA